MSGLIDWTEAKLRWTGGGEHELDVAHRLRERAAGHFARELLRWQSSQKVHLRYNVQHAADTPDRDCSGRLTIRGGLLRVSAPALKEVLERLASAAQTKGEREDREDRERIRAWLESLQEGRP